MTDERVCDQCKTPLLIHGRTLAGQACDLHMAFVDLWRAILGPRLWWRWYGQPLTRKTVSTPSDPKNRVTP